jgi:hypothetical protein
MVFEHKPIPLNRTLLQHKDERIQLEEAFADGDGFRWP